MKKIKIFISIICLMVVGILFTKACPNVMATMDTETYPEITLEVSSENVLPGSTITATSRVHLDNSFVGLEINSFTIMYYVFNVDNYVLEAQEVKTNQQYFSDYGFTLGFTKETVDYYDDCLLVTIQVLAPMGALPIFDGNDMTFQLDFKVSEAPTNTNPIKFYQDPYDAEYSAISMGDIGYYDTNLIMEEITKEVTISQPNSTTSLSSLTIGENTYTDTDLANVLTNGIEVEADVSSLNVSAVVADNGTVTSITGPNGTGSPVSLNDPGENTTISILATAENNVATETHNIVVKRKQYAINTLESLDITLPTGVKGNISLSPSFSKEVVDYTLSLPEGADELLVNPTVTSNVFIQGVTINGATATSGTKNTIDISTASELSIIVTAQDGSTKTYTVALDKKSDDNSLNASGVIGNVLNGSTVGDSISFTQNGDIYTANVGYTNVTGFQINATPNNSNASIVFDPTSKKINFSGFAQNSQTITFTITSESGIEREYTVTVTREKANEDTDFTLTVKGDATNTIYEKNSASTDTLYIYEVPESEGTVTLDYVANSETTTFQLVGTPTIGGADVTLKIIPENTDLTKTITISIRKAKETDNEIKSLELLDKENGTSIVDKNGKTLTFNKDTKQYTFIFPYTVSSVYIKATCANTAKLNGTALGTINLEAGKTASYTVYATSEANVDGEVYTITITREAASTDAYLTDLQVNGVTIDEFSSDGVDYTVRFEHSTTSATITATGCALSTVTGDKGVITLTPGGSKTLTIIVTAQDGITSKTYKIHTYCKEDINEITDITISDVDYTFNSEETTKSFNVPYATSKVTLGVEKSGSYSQLTVKFNGQTADIGELNLKVGSNTIVVYSTSEYGTKGTEYTYTIVREAASSDALLTELKINDELISGYSTTQTLEIKYGHDLDLINVVPKASENATITGDTGVISLTPGGTRTLTITVTAQDGVTKNVYRFEIVCKEDINEITDITISDVEYTFNKDEVTKSFNVPYATSKVTLDVVKSGDYSQLTVKFNGQTADVGELNLTVGTNTIVVYSTSEYGTKGTEYTYTIVREAASSDALLTELKINDELISGYSTTQTLEIKYGHDLDLINVVPKASENATITGDIGAVSLTKGGTTLLTITVTAQDGVTKNVYKINVVCKEDINEITDITISDVDYTFNKDEVTKSFNVPYATSKVTLGVVKSGDYSQLTVKLNGQTADTGELNLTVGTNTIVVYSTSEYGTKGTEYTYTIKRGTASSDAYLTDLQVNGATVDEFSSDGLNYTVRLEHQTTNATITATECALSTVTGDTGVITLTPGGSKTLTIIVTAQDGITSKTYKINVYCKEDINEITDITISDVDYTFNSEETTKSFNVPYATSKVTLGVVKSGDYSQLTVTLNGKTADVGELALNVGTNTIVVYSTSEYGTKGTEYTYTIERGTASSDAYLTDLQVNGATVDEFSSDGLNYIVRLEHSTTSATITATECALSTVTGDTGVITLTPGGSKTLTIIVTAQDGITSKTYKINVYCKEDINEITDITISDVDYTFNKDEVTKSFNVPYATSKVTLDVVKSGDYSQLTVKFNGQTADVGELNLTVGTNTIVVYSTSEYGTKGTEYTYTIVRAEADNGALLTELKINDELISGYSTTQTLEIKYGHDLDLINVVAKASENATITGDIGAVSLTKGGTTLLTITVTAQDGVTKNVYKINVVCKEDINEITDITISDVDYTFNKDEVTKSFNVPYATSKVTLGVVKSGDYSQLTVKFNGQTADTGELNLTVGTNTIVVYSTSEYGTKGTEYTYTIKRGTASSDAYLTDLQVNGATVDEFSSDGPNYTVRLEHQTTNATITATECALSTVTGDTGVITLTPGGSKTLTIIVTAQDGITSKTYKINVYCKEDINEITDITISDVNYTFNSEETTKSFNVPYATSKVTLGVVKSGDYSQLTVTLNGKTADVGELALNVGTNTIVVYSTSEYGTKGTEYSYTIERGAASSDAYLTDLQVNGATVDEFSSDGLNYTVRLEHSTTSATITATECALSTVTGDTGVITLTPGGSKTLTIIVTAQDGITSKTYKINVYCKEDINEITDITISDVDYTFNSEETTKSFNVPYTTSKVTLGVVKSGDYSQLTVTLNGKTSDVGELALNVGTNTIVVYSTSEYGTKGTEYTYTIVRAEADNGALLIELKINDELISGYSTTQTLEIKYGHDLDLINVVAKASENATITGDIGAVSLTKGGTTLLTITVTAQDGVTKNVYKINVVCKEDINEITDITISDVDYTFNSEETTKSFNVPYATSKVTLGVVKSGDYSQLTVKFNGQTADIGELNLKVGSNTIVVYSTSEYGTKGTEYTYTIKRGTASSDAYLTDLQVNGATVDEFSSDGLNYTVRLEHQTTNATITATECALSTVTGDTGVITLTPGGSKTLTIIVTAQDGITSKTYKINVYCKEDINEITDITISDVDYTFNSEETTKSFNVPYATSKVTLGVVKSGDYSQLTVTLNGKTADVGELALNVGTNTIVVYSTSEYGTKGTEYTYTIVRAEADNGALLTELKINDELISGYSTTQTLEIKYGHDLDLINVVAKPSENATITGDIGAVSLTPGGTTLLTITVTAQDGVTKNVYKISVVCKEDINEITNITISDVDYTFNKDEVTKSFNVPYATSKVTLGVVKSGDYSQLTVKFNGQTADIGELNLKVGSNTIVVYSTSEYGTKGTEYTYTIVREAASSDAYLTDLQVNGATVDEFSSDGLNYTVRLEHQTTNATITATECALSTVTGDTGVITLTPGGSKTLTIIVTAQDGITSKTYKINVYCKEDINEITDITISDVEYTFNKDEVTKSFNVPYATSKVTLGVVKSGDYSQLTVTLNGKTADVGELALNVGTNTIVVYSTSEYGTKGTEYTYTIEREVADTDATLSSLEFIVDGINLLEGFDPEGIRYQVIIDSSITTVTGRFSATTTSSVAEILTDLSTDINIQNQPNQTITISVKAQDGTIKNYYVTIVREGAEFSANVDIDDITIVDDSQNNYIEFNKDVPNYEINLPYNIGSLLITIVTPDGANSSKFGDGPISIEQGGQKVITLYVVAQNSVDESQKYTVTINRAKADTTAQLNDITINGISLPDFSSTKYIYEYRVDHNVNEVLINATAYSTASIITPLGSKNLSIGSNEVVITVLAQDGTTNKSYTINVVRAEDKYTIENIEFEDVDYQFDKEITNPGRIKVPYSMKNVDVNVFTDASYAKIYIDINGKIQTNGIVVLNVGINNIKIYAVSEYGTRGTEYIFEIERLDANNNTYLSNLEVEIEGVNKIASFDKETTSYTIENVGDSVTSVFIKATPESNLSSVTGVGNILLNTAITEGNTMILYVTVTSESQSVRVYTIYISRGSVNLDDNNDITNIVIHGTDGKVYFNEFNSSEHLINISDLPYSVSGVVVSVETPVGAGSTITGGGLHSFTSNQIEIEVYATSASGTKGDSYIITITRNEPDSNANLEFIKIDGAIISNFNSSVYQYNLKVNNSVSYVDISYKAVLDSTNVEIIFLGNSHSGLQLPLIEGAQNIISIVATAQNGTKIAYTVTIVRAAKDGVLSELYIDGIQFHEEGKPNSYVYYDESITTYYATVANSYHSINIIASALDSTVEIRGTGFKNLEVGYNEFQVAAIPSTGNVAIYNIIVIRKASTNGVTDADKIIIEEIEEFGNVYSNDIDLYLSEYNFAVNSNITKLTFDIDFGTEEFEESANYEIIGNKLEYGKNIVIIKITASDTITIRYIMIQVTRQQVKINNASISQIQSFSEDLNDNNDSYYYEVSNDVTKLDFTISVEDGVTYEINKKDLEEGNNEILITFKNGDEVARVIKLNVYRQVNNKPNVLFVGGLSGGSALIMLFAFGLLIRRKKRGK